MKTHSRTLLVFSEHALERLEHLKILSMQKYADRWQLSVSADPDGENRDVET